MRNKIIIILSVFLVLTVGSYSLVWFWAAGKIKNETLGILDQAQEENISITTRYLGLNGYPGKHTVVFAGLLETDGVILDLKRLEISSLFFIPGREITISLPEGAAIKEPADPVLWSLSKLRIRGPIPESLPADLTRESLTAWKAVDGQIKIDHFEIHKETLRLNGDGFLTLDSDLQPAGEANIRMRGHMEFLSWLQKQDVVKTKDLLLATTVMRGLSRNDGGKEPYMDGSLTLQNRTLFLGPLKVGHLPKIHWAWRSQPALLQ